MRKCEFENLIDDYLFERMSEGKKEEFEEHYFNCSYCFEKMAERYELIKAIKYKGDEIFKDLEGGEEKRWALWYEKFTSFFTPRQWAAATVIVGVLLIAIIALLPRLKTSSPAFFINEDLVRGESITLISPVIEVGTIPYEFTWKKLAEDVEYKIYLYNEKLLWTGVTKENFILLPEEIRGLMSAGEKYSWQVKAFSKEGILVAVSSIVQFRIKK